MHGNAKITTYIELQKAFCIIASRIILSDPLAVLVNWRFPVLYMLAEGLRHCTKTLGIIQCSLSFNMHSLLHCQHTSRCMRIVSKSAKFKLLSNYRN